MTTYNYRIVRHPDGNLSLCEVIYQDGVIIEIIKRPLFSAYTAGGETEKHIVGALKNALKDARGKSIINEDSNPR